MQVADRWEAAGLLAEASKALCLDTTTFPTLQVFCLPDVLRASAGYSAVMEAGKAQLLNTFGDARSIITTRSLLRDFLALPGNALTALLQNPNFKTDAEESVLMLARCWCDKGQGKDCSQEQLHDINSCIRYSRLSAPHSIGLCSESSLPLPTTAQLSELLEHKFLPNGVSWSDDQICCPQQWYLPKRLTCNSSIQLTLTVGLDKLKQMLSPPAATTTASRPVYGAGFMWSIKFGTNYGKLKCGVYVHGLASVSYQAAPGRVSLKRGIAAEYSLTLHSSAPAGINLVLIQATGRPRMIKSSGAAVDMEWSGDVYKDADKLEWWAPYIKDDGVHFSAVVTRHHS